MQQVHHTLDGWLSPAYGCGTAPSPKKLPALPATTSCHSPPCPPCGLHGRSGSSWVPLTERSVQGRPRAVSHRMLAAYSPAKCTRLALARCFKNSCALRMGVLLHAHPVPQKPGTSWIRHAAWRWPSSWLSGSPHAACCLALPCQYAAAQSIICGSAGGLGPKQCGARQGALIG